METKICSKCGIEKLITEYHKNGFNSRGEQKYRGYCKACANKLETERYWKKREFVDNQRTVCEKCGEKRTHVLDFHHIDPKEKSFTIGALKKGSQETILNEINKCVCLCANCHRDFHYLERISNITILEYLNK